MAEPLKILPDEDQQVQRLPPEALASPAFRSIVKSRWVGCLAVFGEYRQAGRTAPLEAKLRPKETIHTRGPRQRPGHGFVVASVNRRGVPLD